MVGGSIDNENRLACSVLSRARRTKQKGQCAFLKGFRSPVCRMTEPFHVEGEKKFVSCEQNFKQARHLERAAGALES